MVESSAVVVDVRVKPRRALLRNGVIAALVGGIPLFTVLYWLAIEQGSWLRVLVVQLAVSAAAVILWLRFRAGFAQVTDSTITKQAFANLTTVKCPDVASILVAQTYNGNSDTTAQLVLFDSEGDRLLRMRGLYWNREDMVRVAEAIGAPILYEQEPVTIKEFYAAHPGVAYWYEGRPWLAVLGIVVALGVAFVLMSWLMAAIGAPSVLSMPV